MLEVIHEALTKDVVITKREIYYRDPALFHNQTVVDRLIDDMAFTIGVPRASLNVSAAAKGLTVGAFAINSSDGSQTQNFLTQEGLLIPKLNDGDTISMPAVRWILVVEKEAPSLLNMPAVFRALITSSFWGLHRHQGIVLTGKGYPDLHTRTLLHTLSTPSPRNAHATASVHALVDLDPDGLAILATYKHGSRALAHEAITTRVPGLHWLGVRSQDALNAMVAGKEDSSGGEALLLRLTRRDRAMAARMLQRTECAEEETWRRELQIMLMLNIKAEIEALEEGWRGGLAAWLGMKLSGAWVERESG
ncbi:uncharacterized protein K452DRAFT_252957 [Aplosporella prunicola CBS 121167]|uniref:DNA topoisomerase (ATP-hydrolyzing) n=1 Tax=Aplosporella prunicola CBS 121167 TaxID=1176127 RepID=A0A6A6BA46_9PEZI|nr:uncharacterized protein K452DRAFT_252957 [Aplosporella prunicola CBS 121167]KAF2140243.1 hypothetical protein K452DRAFT_252957 [Aplosporella prunicola CBS 121167]